MDTNSLTFRFFFIVGRVFFFAAVALVLSSVIAFFFRRIPPLFLSALEIVAFVLVATATLIGLAYISEAWIALNSKDIFERILFENRIAGPYAWSYWLLFTSNALLPQLFWFRRVRIRPVAIFLVAGATFIPELLWRFILVIFR